MSEMLEIKPINGAFLANQGNVPAIIKAKSGPIIWKQLGGCWRLPQSGDWELHLNGEVKYSSHEYLIVAVGGTAQLTVDEDGRTIAFGTGISAPTEPQSPDPAQP